MDNESEIPVVITVFLIIIIIISTINELNFSLKFMYDWES